MSCADKVMLTTIRTYFVPNRTIPELHGLMKSRTGVDPLKDFAEAVRDELQAFPSRWCGNGHLHSPAEPVVVHDWSVDDASIREDNRDADWLCRHRNDGDPDRGLSDPRRPFAFGL
jgi:hypothetical protein